MQLKDCGAGTCMYSLVAVFFNHSVSKRLNFNSQYMFYAELMYVCVISILFFKAKIMYIIIYYIVTLTMHMSSTLHKIV